MRAPAEKSITPITSVEHHHREVGLERREQAEHAEHDRNGARPLGEPAQSRLAPLLHDQHRRPDHQRELAELRRLHDPPKRKRRDPLMDGEMAVVNGSTVSSSVRTAMPIIGHAHFSEALGVELGETANATMPAATPVSLAEEEEPARPSRLRGLERAGRVERREAEREQRRGEHHQHARLQAHAPALPLHSAVARGDRAARARPAGRIRRSSFGEREPAERGAPLFVVGEHVVAGAGGASRTASPGAASARARAMTCSNDDPSRSTGTWGARSASISGAASP
jgi:hypothetical protein